MLRIAHIIAPGYPHHITQRGNNRATVFFDDEDLFEVAGRLHSEASCPDLDLF
jgi:putative transposase